MEMSKDSAILQMRLVRVPPTVRVNGFGGEGRIRTYDAACTACDLENRRFQPLSHLSIPVNINGAYLITEARKES